MPHRIMIVDDDATFGKIAEVAFRTDDTAVDVTLDGLQALQRLRDGHYDLIIVDLEMPGMDGFSLIRNIRRERGYETTDIIVVTGRKDLRAIDLSYQLGAVSFVTKPVNWRLLPYKVRDVLSRVTH
jgi:DNA-binding response OmpR family regulator